jgi:PilZ domain-containing protein
MPMPADLDDVIEVPAPERRDDVRVIVNMPGRYMLASKRNLKGERCEFACRIVNVSLGAMALAAPVPGPLGERVIVYSEQFGRLHGSITRLMTTGFVMSVAANPQTREKLAAKLDWLAKQKDSPDLPDSRRHARVVPKNPIATLLQADGSLTSCLVIDFSDSGAAVSADLYPAIGTPLAVGKMVGRVVRRFAEGFAIEFTEKVNLADVERRLARGDASSLRSVKSLLR